MREAWMVETSGSDPKFFYDVDHAIAEFEDALRMPLDEFMTIEDGRYAKWVEGSVEEGCLSVDDGPRLVAITIR